LVSVNIPASPEAAIYADVDKAAGRMADVSFSPSGTISAGDLILPKRAIHAKTHTIGLLLEAAVIF
jgi:hypothetical protein